MTEKFLPTKIDIIVDSLKFKSKLVLKKNIAYNIQYLQYLDKCITEEETTSVIKRLRIKNYVIVSMSIIESIFIALLDENDFIPYVEWKEKGKHYSRIIDENTEEYIIKRERVKPYSKKETIKFDKAIALVKKNKILFLKENMWKFINFFKNLRNYIHLDKVEFCADSDYNTFGELTYLLSKEILYTILNNNKVSCNKEYIKFLEGVKIIS